MLSQPNRNFDMLVLSQQNRNLDMLVLIQQNRNLDMLLLSQPNRNLDMLVLSQQNRNFIIFILYDALRVEYFLPDKSLFLHITCYIVMKCFRVPVYQHSSAAAVVVVCSNCPSVLCIMVPEVETLSLFFPLSDTNLHHTCC